jgi:hypothetical protein
LELDLNLFAGRPGRDPAASVRTGELPATLGRLDPTRTFRVDAETLPLAGRVGDAFDCFQSAFTAEAHSCFGNAGRIPDDPTTSFDDGVFYDLDRFFAQHQNDYLDGVRYEIPVAAFDVPDDRLAPATLAGFASLRPPNVQAWSYVMVADRARAALITDTGAIAHEVGHHLGLSHVHDTYDPVLDADLSAYDGGTFWFLIAGTEAYTAMSYLPNTDEFGRFDRDHMARWQVAARLDNANRILGDVARSPRAGKAAGLAGQADARAGQAIALLGQWDLLGASQAAADAYRLVLAAAAAANVKVEPFSGVADQGPGAGVIAGAVDPLRLALQPSPADLSAGPVRYLP